MRLASGVILALAAMTLVGCGGPSKAAQTRKAVNGYLDNVDQSQATLLTQVGQIDLDLQAFSIAKTTPTELRGLVGASAMIGDALRKLRAITPPPAARRLHAELLQRLELEESVTAELVETARYLPRIATVLQPLRAAAAALGRGIAGVKSPPPTPGGTGVELWTAAGCGSCHTLAQAGSNGQSGPNLDDVRPSSAMVAAQVRSGGGGMPSYRTALTATQVTAVASYVSSVAGHPRRVASPTGSATAPTQVSADVYQQYAAVFAAYRTTIEPILARLDRLSAPLELRSGLLAERLALRTSTSLCRSIEAALLRHDVNAANARIQQLFEVASGVNAAKARKAQAAAGRAYDAQLKEISALAIKITSERARLVQTVG